MSKKESNQNLCESVSGKESTPQGSACLNPGGQEADVGSSGDGTVSAEKESPQPSEADTFTRTISPPTLGTLRSCFSWSGSLGDFSSSPNPTPGSLLQRFRRRSGSPTPQPESSKSCDAAQLKANESRDGVHHLPQEDCSVRTQESMQLSPHSLNTSKLSQPSSTDSDSEVSQILKTLFSNLYIEEKVFK